jgi:mono/diheme cytochrome c family protein
LFYILERKTMRNKAILLIVVGLLLVGAAACGQNAAPTPTQAPTLVPTTVPSQVPTDTPTLAPTITPTSQPAVARPSNPGGAGQAIALAGDASAGAKVFAQNCVICHAADGKGNIANAGSSDGTVPPLKPIDDTIKSSDYLTFAYNVDLFVEHGSTPDGNSPAFKMPAWGDQNKLTPQQIADVIAYVINLNDPTLKPVVKASLPTPKDMARPSNAGGAGLAITLTGDANSGAKIFAENCVMCHAAEGKGNIANAGSSDGTVPPLNPIDDTIKNTDPVVFTYNVDLFVEHGSTPDGASPTFSMPAWGDQNKLTPQQIADVIAYVISLNK